MEIVRPGPDPLEQFREVLGSMVGLIKALMHSKETGVGPSSVSGPVGILGLWWYGIVTGGLLQGINIAVMLNLNFAVINLFPFPVLDGGHITFAAIEAIRRRPLNARVVQTLSSAFAILLITFMLYITVFDFKRFFGFRFGSSSRPEQTNEAAPATQP
jgi:regulator of sigma E protease